MLLAITGAGMLGTALAARLRDGGHEVRVIDAVDAPGVEVANLLELPDLAAALDGVDGVFHTAGLHGWRDNPPLDFLETNVRGVWNLLEAMRTAGITRLVHSSTVGAYGDPGEVDLTIDGDTAPTARVDVYGTSKRLAEHVIDLLAPKFSIDAVVLRYGGFRQLIEQRFGAVPADLAAHGPVVDLEDVVTANVAAMARLPLPRLGYIVIPSGGTSTSNYRIDASTTEKDLGFTFRHTYRDICEASA